MSVLTNTRFGALAAAALPAMLCAAFSAPTHATTADKFADTVVSSSNLSTNPTYSDPNAALGKPATLVNGIYDVPRGIYHASMVYGPYNKDPQGNNLLVNLGASGTGQVTVSFNTPITHDPHHWYGEDFILHGNSFFTYSSGSVTPTVDMNTVILTNTIYVSGSTTVSVSNDGVNFVALTPVGPYWPSNPYLWVGNSSTTPSGWYGFADFTKPMNPKLTPDSFNGLSVATAAQTLYAGAAGGEAFTLAGTEFADTGISYIRFSGTGNIDAVARVGNNPAPLAPAALVGRPTAPGGASVQWSPAATATSYDVSRGTAPGGESATPIATGVTGSSYTDADAVAGQAYYYTVTAVNKFGESTSASPEASVVAAAATLMAPKTAGFTVVNQGGSALLTWTAVPGATAYAVYRKVDSNPNELYRSGVAATSFTDTSVATGHTYAYSLATTDQNGTGSIGQRKSVTF